jgi:hypothetical protein
MNYLQLHDGPGDNFPSFTGKIQPLNRSYDTTWPGGPVVVPGKFYPFGGCDMNQIKAQAIPGNKTAWNTRLSDIQNAKTLWANTQSLLDTKGTGSVPVYDSNGVITSYKPGSKAEVNKAYFEMGVKIGQFLRGVLDTGQTNRLIATAQELWDQNKWNIQNLCNQSLPDVLANTQLCYDGLQWWIAEQAKKQAAWFALPGYKRNNIASPTLAGELRIANRNVVVRQNYLTILMNRVSELGGTFDPNKQNGGGSKNIAALLTLAVAGASLLR